MDTEARIAAFTWLKSQSDIYGEVFPRKILESGFSYKGERVPLLGPQGIFKPKIFPIIPLSITTTSNSPYDDGKLGGFLSYKYRGIDPLHRDNIGLRMAMEQQIPLVYFYSLTPGKYFAMWPVYIISENRADLSFTVAVDDEKVMFNSFNETQNQLVREPEENYRRSYITTAVKQRLHQKGFRERVIEAYQSCCALCKIKHSELLDAAHIIPDGEIGGEPTVNNGIALCKIHHAAFDNFFFGIRRDYIIEIRKDILEEKDGPMLELGFKGLHNNKIILPKKNSSWPSVQKLEERYQKFKKAV